MKRNNFKEKNIKNFEKKEKQKSDYFVNKAIQEEKEAKILLDFLFEKQGERVSLTQIDELGLFNDATSLTLLLVEKGYRIEIIHLYQKADKVFKRIFLKLV